ncbi:MAG: hypothetical protein N3A54_06630 [Patescibacteria group bacterium]|nr:hypothetical protein [Patescibacteria group bacterium]
MRKITLIILIVMFYFSLYGQNEAPEIERYFDDITSSKFKKVFASSFLIEKGMPKDYYSPQKAFDGNINTAWVEGVEGDGIGEFIIFPINILGSRYDQKPPKINLKIINGYAKNKKLFLLNNRVKKVLFEVYEAPITFISNAETGDYTFQRINKVLLSFSTVINLRDEIFEQSFSYIINLKHIPLKYEYIYGLIGKFVIYDVYPGKKLKDTCISEISISGTSEYEE